MPDHSGMRSSKGELLTFDEIVRIAGIFVGLGIEKIRLTGGEPLIRPSVPALVRLISAFRPHLKDIAMTTNGSRFADCATDLRSAGLNRVTFSLDSLDRRRFAAITGSDGLERVIDSIQLALRLGFSPVKVNVVVVRGRNDDEIPAFADFARKYGISVRFIEFMPLDSSRAWKRNDVVTGKEVIDQIAGRFKLVPKMKLHPSDTANNFIFADGSPGEIGIIAPVSQNFCGQCSRIRLTADGQIRTCLFSQAEYDLRSVLRSGASDYEITQLILNAVRNKEKGHRINESGFEPPVRPMRLIGG